MNLEFLCEIIDYPCKLTSFRSKTAYGFVCYSNISACFYVSPKFSTKDYLSSNSWIGTSWKVSFSLSLSSVASTRAENLPILSGIWKLGLNQLFLKDTIWYIRWKLWSIKLIGPSSSRFVEIYSLDVYWLERVKVSAKLANAKTVTEITTIILKKEPQRVLCVASPLYRTVTGWPNLSSDFKNFIIYYY